MRLTLTYADFDAAMDAWVGAPPPVGTVRFFIAAWSHVRGWGFA